MLIKGDGYKEKGGERYVCPYCNKTITNSLSEAKEFICLPDLITRDEFKNEIEYIYVLNKYYDIEYSITDISHKCAVIQPYHPCKRWDRSFETTSDEAYDIFSKEKFTDVRWKT